MSSRDSIDGIVEAVLEWIRLQAHGVIWIRYSSDVSRDQCIQRLRDKLSTAPLLFDPPDPAFAASWLESILDSIPDAQPLPVLSLQFPIAIRGSEEDLLAAFHALNLRRELLLQRPLIQLWWISDRLSPKVEIVAPDLASWFKVRLRLREVVGSALRSDDDTGFNQMRMDSDAQRAISLAHAKSDVQAARRRVALCEQGASYDLAIALGSLSIKFAALGELQPALESATESLSILRLLESSGKVDSAEIAGALNNLANRQSEVGKREEALGTAEEAVKNYRELAGRNRDAFLPDLAMSLGALSQVHVARQEHDRAHDCLKEGLELIVPLYELLPAAFVSLTLQLANDYRAACEQTSQAPDQSLLDRIAAQRPPQ